MIEPVSIHIDDMVSDAFKLMHRHKLPGMPVVDDENHVVGFLSLLELMELVVMEQKPSNE